MADKEYQNVDISKFDSAINELQEFYRSSLQNPLLSGLNSKLVGEIGELIVARELLTRNHQCRIIKKGGHAGCDIELSVNGNEHRLEVRTKHDNGEMNNGAYLKSVKGIGWRILGKGAKRKFDFIVLLGIDDSANKTCTYILSYDEAYKLSIKEPDRRYSSTDRCIHLLRCNIDDSILRKTTYDDAPGGRTNLCDSLKKIADELPDYDNGWAKLFK